MKQLRRPKLIGEPLLHGREAVDVELPEPLARVVEGVDGGFDLTTAFRLHRLEKLHGGKLHVAMNGGGLVFGVDGRFRLRGDVGPLIDAESHGHVRCVALNRRGKQRCR